MIWPVRVKEASLVVLTRLEVCAVIQMISLGDDYVRKWTLQDHTLLLLSSNVRNEFYYILFMAPWCHQW